MKEKIKEFFKSIIGFQENEEIDFYLDKEWAYYECWTKYWKDLKNLKNRLKFFYLCDMWKLKPQNREWFEQWIDILFDLLDKLVYTKDEERKKSEIQQVRQVKKSFLY